MRDEYKKQLEDNIEEQAVNDQRDLDKPLVTTDDGEIIIETTAEAKSNNNRTVSMDETKDAT